MINNIGVIAMPTYRQFPLKQYDLRVSVKPLGIRHILCCLPYLTGQTAEFIIILETISGKQREFSHSSTCYFISSDKTARQITSDEILILQTDNMIQTKLSIPFISLLGHYSAELTFNYRGMTRFEPVIELYAISKDLLIANLFITSITLIIGGIIGWLLGHF